MAANMRAVLLIGHGGFADYTCFDAADCRKN
jgi:hypothetical protein